MAQVRAMSVDVCIAVHNVACAFHSVKQAQFAKGAGWGENANGATLCFMASFMAFSDEGLMPTRHMRHRLTSYEQLI